jgi:hypothetical protein
LFVQSSAVCAKRLCEAMFEVFRLEHHDFDIRAASLRIVPIADVGCVHHPSAPSRHAFCAGTPQSRQKF